MVIKNVPYDHKSRISVFGTSTMLNFIPHRHSLSISAVQTQCYLISLKFYSSSSFSFYITSCILFNFVKTFTLHCSMSTQYHIQARYRFILHRLHLLPVSAVPRPVQSRYQVQRFARIRILGRRPLSLTNRRRFNTRCTSPRLLSFICIQSSRVA